MMTSLIELSEKYTVVGFDLDGTIYDEFDFINQFYKSLCETLDDQVINGCHEFACKLWLENGSGYPYIFRNIHENYYLGELQLAQFIEFCITTYRKFVPTLQVSKRAEFVLETLSVSKSLFLVSDGTPELQKRKFDSLGLSRFFAESSQFYTGFLGSEFYKPCPRILRGSYINKASNVIFFGDRDVDRSFAKNCGFQFNLVKNMELLDAN